LKALIVIKEFRKELATADIGKHHNHNVILSWRKIGQLDYLQTLVSAKDFDALLVIII